ncbi:hypothetical protein [Aquimonas sp.]|jgi:hypothetical protein|uniref:hypothetical protein n=1 Tax=Aquimonas sp. TaxID=1872588 RepID=UPI0037BF4565
MTPPNTSALITLPSTLAARRALVVSDATFAITFDDGSESPVWVTRGDIRGTVTTVKRMRSGNGDAANIEAW